MDLLKGRMLRILSDLHVFDGMSRVRRLEQLNPLLEEPDALVLNGDSCDTQVGASPEQVEMLRAHLRERAPRATTLITGNHDPDISSVHEHLLHDGRIWVTHGDIFFPEATPWSRVLPELRRRIAAAKAADPHADVHSADWRLRVFRQISHQLPLHGNLKSRGLLARLSRIVTEFHSPLRLWAVLQAWRHGPALGADLARRHRPAAQVIVFGHIHRPSLTRHGHRTAINTGAFAGALASWCVDVHEAHVCVRRIVRYRDSFRAGEVVAEIPLAAGLPKPISSAA